MSSLFIICGLLCVIFYCMPAKFLYALNNFLELKLARAENKEIIIDGVNVKYYQGGRGEATVLLLHGFGASKENWNKLSKALTKHHKVYAIDLPGFGETEAISIDTGITQYRDFVIKFINVFKLKDVKLVGHSTGGLIAAHVARSMPETIIKLWLISPLGAEGNYATKMTRYLSQGKNILLPSNLSDFANLVDILFYKKPFIPKKIISFLGEKSVASHELHKSLFNSTHQLRNNKIKVEPSLNEILKDYPRDIYLSWGEEDELLSYLGGTQLKKQIPLIKFNLKKNIGHMYPIENPEVPEFF